MSGTCFRVNPHSIVCDMIIINSQMHRTDNYSQHCLFADYSGWVVGGCIIV